MDHEGAGLLVRVDVPDLKSQTRVIINRMDPVEYAKQAVLEKLSHDWPIDVANNYGFYIPPSGGRKVGRFLDESRPLVDEHVTITHLELRYKRRDYTGLGFTEKALVKANSKSNTKKLIEYVTSGSSIKKIEKLLDSGLDPNFIMDDGNTPLGVVCGRNGRAELIQSLIAGGAHIDFKGNAGLTPIHRAAIGGNVQAMKTLLSLGASPNYIDSKGLTPLYHACIMGDDISVCDLLLKHNAFVGNTDNIGWTELHQIAKHGYIYMIDLMLLYGGDINALNKAGNTPLHVAAQHGQLETAIHLMRRGANRSISNTSKQPPNQIAILCGHHRLAKEIADFDDSEIEILQSKKKQRHSFGDDSQTDHHTVHQPTAYSSKTLPSKKTSGPTSMSSKLVKGQTLQTQASTATTTQVPSLSTSPLNKGHSKQAPPPPVITIGNKRSKSKEVLPTMGVSGTISEPTESPRSRGRRYSTDHKKSSPGPSPVLLAKCPSPTGEIRERLYPISQPGKTYIANTSVEPQMEGDLPLTKGALVEVMYIGKGGFWEGKSQGRQGWFPQNAISEKIDDDEISTLPPVNSTPFSTEDTLETKSGIKVIAIRKGEKGFGFAMRGIKAVNVAKFKPSPHVPALQYVARIDKGSSAEICGLQKGDFIIEVNGINTTKSTHEEVVSIIKQSDSVILKMKVITPAPSPQKKKTTTDKQTPPSPNTANKEDTSPKLQPSMSQRLSQDSEEEIKSQRKISTLATVSHSMTPPNERKDNQSIPPVKEVTCHDSPVVKPQNKLVTTTNTALSTEELVKKEKDSYKKLMEEETEEEGSLSPFAQQLRKASQDRFKRSTNNTPLTKNDTKKEEQIAPANNTREIDSHYNSQNINQHDSQERKSDGKYDIDDHYYGNQDDNEDDGWEYTETLTDYNEITAMPITDSPHTEAPKKYILDSNKESIKASPKIPLRNTTQSPKTTLGRHSSPKALQSKIESSSVTAKKDLGRQSPLTKVVPKKDVPLSRDSPTSSPKKNYPLSSSSPKTITSSPKRDYPLLANHSLSSNKDQSSSLVKKESPLSPKKENSFPSPKKDFPLPKKDNFPSPKKDHSTSAATTSTSPKAPPPVTKPKPSHLNKDLSSSKLQPKDSPTSSIKPLPSKDSSMATKKLDKEQEKEKEEDQQPISQPFTSLKDKFEKLAQNKPQQSPVFVKRRQPTKPLVTKMAVEKQEQKEQPKKEIEPIVSKKEEDDTALPPPVLDDINSNRFSVISFEDLPLPLDLQEEIDNEKKSHQQLPFPSPPPAVISSPSPSPPPAVMSPPSPSPPPAIISSSSPSPPPAVISPPSPSPPPAVISPPSPSPSPAVISPPSPSSPLSPPVAISPPPPLPSDEIDLATLPPPGSHENEEQSSEPSFTLPPPLMSDSEDSADEDMSPLPPHVYIDEREESNKEQTESFPPPPVNDQTDTSNDLLNNIVGQLMKLTNNNSDDDDDSDNDSLPPPPLPSRPPPESDDEDDLPHSHQDNPPLLPSVEEPAKDETSPSPSPSPPPPPAVVTEEDLIPPPFDSLLPPPPADDDQEEEDLLPPADTFEDDTFIPPPFEDDDDQDELILPPPIEDSTSFETLPPAPSFEELEFPPPPLSQEDSSIPPPPQVDYSDDDDDQEGAEGDLLPPPPLQLDESFEYEDNPHDNESLLPPPPLSESSDEQDESLSQTTESDEEEGETPVSSWSVDEVCKWLDDIGLGMYRETFESNEIIGEHLIDLSRDDLRDLGITKLGHIKTLKQKLQERLNT